MSKKGEILELYQLIDKYWAEVINEVEFCEAFFELYDMTINTDDLTDVEEEAFDGINNIVGDYFELKANIPAYLNDDSFRENLRQKIEKTKSGLDVEDIYERNDKRRLYWLIHQYLKEKIDEETFSSKFFMTYVLGINRDDLNEIEKKAFSDLYDISERTSSSEADHLIYPRVYFTKEDLKQKIMETQKILES